MYTHDSPDALDDAPFPARVSEAARQLHWPTLLSGIAIGLVVMQLLVARTVNTRMDELAREVIQARKQVLALAGSSEDVHRTNDLLALLNRQRHELKNANEAVTELRRLRSRIGQEGAQLTEALAVLDQVRQLQSDLIDQRSQLDQATKAVSAAVALQSRVSEMSRSLPDQAAGIAEAEAVLAELAGLKQRTLAAAVDLPAAREQLDGLSVLMKGLAGSGEQMLQAKVAASGLVAMKDMLMIESDGLDRSQRTAEQLLTLNDTLSQARQIQVDEATHNLNAMLRNQQQLASQTRMIAQSVENLEILVDFQEVLSEQLAKVDGLRRQLTELVLMESTIARAAQTLTPLLQIGQMRGLGEEDAREAARVILDRRAGRTTTTRTADGAGGDVISVSSPDDVFDDTLRPVPVPPTE